MGKIRFGLIGSGWRAEFYIRIAKAMPDVFELSGVLVRDEAKGRRFAKQMDVTVINTLDELEKTEPEYIVLAVKRGILSEYLPKLFEKGIPVLCETPPGESLEALESVWKSYKKYNGKILSISRY